MFTLTHSVLSSGLGWYTKQDIFYLALEVQYRVSWTHTESPAEITEVPGDTVFNGAA